MASLLARALDAAGPAGRPPPRGGSSRAPAAGGPLDSLGQATSGGAPTNLATAVTIINFVSDELGAMPVRVVERGDRTRRPVEDLAHEYLWGGPNSEADAASWWQTLWMHYEGWNEAFVFLRRVGGGVVGMDLLHPSRVKVTVKDSGRRTYAYRPPGAGHKDAVEYTRRDVVHIMRRSWDQVRALPPIAASRPAHRIAAQQDRWQNSHYRLAARPSGILTVPAELDDLAVAEYYAGWDDQVSGPGGKGLLLAQGNAQYTPIMPATDVHLLQSMTFTREQILGAYAPGVPHHLLGWRSNASNWGTGIEQQGLHLLQHVFLPRMHAVGRTLTARLLPRHLRLWWDHGEWLQMDGKGKAEMYTKLRLGGGLTRDEFRDPFDLPVLPIPDDIYTPTNMQTILVERAAA